MLDRQIERQTGRIRHYTPLHYQRVRLFGTPVALRVRQKRAEELYQFRVLTTWTQDQLAKRMGVHKCSIQWWERGIFSLSKPSYKAFLKVRARYYKQHGLTLP